MGQKKNKYLSLVRNWLGRGIEKFLGPAEETVPKM